jgi:membrane protein implicated in regulation of membrane protease activity
MTWALWVLAAVALLIIEIVTPSVFFFTCLAIGAVFAAIIAYFNVSDWVEFGVFAVTAILSLYTIRPIFKRAISKAKTVNSNVDALIGAEGLVIEAIQPDKNGLVKVGGEVWLAQSDVQIDKDLKVEIVSISGTKVIVVKK